MTIEFLNLLVRNYRELMCCMRKFIATLLCLSLFMAAMLNTNLVLAGSLAPGTDTQQQCSQQQEAGCPTESSSGSHQLCASNCWVAQAAIISSPIFTYLAVKTESPQYIPFLYPGDHVEEPFRPPRLYIV